MTIYRENILDIIDNWNGYPLQEPCDHIDNNGKPIRSVKDWLRLAPPKMGIRHWKDGRSAKELATAWFVTGKPNMPKELTKLFESHPLTANFFPELGIPEFVTRLDNFKGELKNFKQICPIEMLDKLKNPISLKTSVKKAS